MSEKPIPESEIIQVTNPQPVMANFMSFPVERAPDPDVSKYLADNLKPISFIVVMETFKRLNSEHRQSLVDSHKEKIDLKHEKEMSNHIAETDELTGLKNRRAMINELNSMIANPGVNPDRYVLMFMDLDGFKAVNDNYGHEAGDNVLRHVAKRLELRKTDIAGRLAGDEFLVIVDTENEAPDRRGDNRPDTNPRRQHRSRKEIIEGLSLHLREQVEQGGRDAERDAISLNIGVSIGVVPLKGFESAAEVIREADVYMYEDKTRHQNDTAHLPGSSV